MLYKYIGLRIKAHRLQNKLTQEQLAEDVGISASFMGHIERGTRKLSVDTLYRLAMVLECSVDELLGTSGNEKKRTSALELLAMAEQMAAMLEDDLESAGSMFEDF